MRARIQNCDQCKKAIAKEQEKACLACQFEMFEATADDIGKAMTGAMIAVFHKRGRTKRYIQQFFNDLIFVLECPEILGKELQAEEMKAEFTKLYGIDFERVKVKVETKEECFHRYKMR